VQNAIAMDNGVEVGLSLYKRTTLADQVYTDLKRLLLSGAVAPGEKITLRGLSEIMGISPMPIRDAVRRLVTEHALEMLPNRTVRVSKPSVEQFREIVEIRCHLEGLAAKKATEKMGAAALKRIVKVADRFDDVAKPETANMLDMVEANRLLHFSLYEQSQMPLLMSMIEGLWVQVAPVFALSMSTQLREIGNMEAFDHHRDLVKALRQRDGLQARQAIEDDIRDAATYIERSGALGT